MAPPTIQQTFDLALQHHEAGRLREAQQLYLHILNQQPQHPDAMHLLGVIAHQTGHNDKALELIQGAIALKPNWPEAHVNLGIALKQQGLLDESIAAHRTAITLNPQNAEAFNNLGNSLAAKGSLDEAIAAFRQAVALKPDYADPHFNLGNALKDLGRSEAAIAAYKSAIALIPNWPEAFNNLGVALNDNGKTKEAIDSCQRALSLRPNYPEAHFNLGNSLKANGQIEEAISEYRRAILLRPNYADAFNNLANSLVEKGQPDDAVAAYQQAIALMPTFAEAHRNLGNALADRGELNEGIAALRQAIALKPGYIEAHSNLVFTLLYHPDYDAKTIAQENRQWSEQHAQPLQKFIQAHSNDLSPDRRLRIGYVSSDFRNHVVGRNILPLFKHHDHQRFEIKCYSQARRPDEFTAQFQQLSHGWCNTALLSDEQLARQIREDRIDILVDLALHTNRNRLLLFAHKPAPVQVTFAGYPGSTGLSTIDYRLSDPYLDPPGTDESVYSERTIRLPDTFWCYDPLDCSDIPVNPLPAKDSGVVTFGCLNSFCKISEAILFLCARVLLQVENSRLLLLAHPGSHRQRLIDRLSQAGIHPNRIEFSAPQPRRKYLELYHRIDIGLDSFPYNGHTTSLDSFWMGVPVVTLVGPRVASRAGWSQLSNLGLTTLAGQTGDEFVRAAVDLAEDLPKLEQLRATLRRRMERSPLMDAVTFAGNIEEAYRRMWHTWCKRDTAAT